MTDARIIVALPPSTDLELVAEALTAAGDQRLRAARAASAELAAEVDAGAVKDERTGAVAIHRTLVTAGILESAAEAIRSGVVDAALAEGDADELTTRIGDLELEVGNLGAKLETANEELAAARQRIGELEAELGPDADAAHAKRIDVLEAALNDAETHRAAAMARIAELEAAVHAEAELIDELAGRDGTPPGPDGPATDEAPEPLSDRQLSRLPLAELKEHLDTHPEDLARAAALEAAAAKPRKKVTEELDARLELADAGITVTAGGQTELIVDGPDIGRMVADATVAQLEQLVAGASTPDALRTAAEEELTLRQPPTPDSPPVEELVKLATTAELEAIADGDTGTAGAGRADSPIAGTGGVSAELMAAARAELVERNRVVPEADIDDEELAVATRLNNLEAAGDIGAMAAGMDTAELVILGNAAGPCYLRDVIDDVLRQRTDLIDATYRARLEADDAAIDPTEDLEPGDLIALEVDADGTARPVDLPDVDVTDLVLGADEEPEADDADPWDGYDDQGFPK